MDVVHAVVAAAAAAAAVVDGESVLHARAALPTRPDVAVLLLAFPTPSLFPDVEFAPLTSRL